MGSSGSTLYETSPARAHGMLTGVGRVTAPPARTIAMSTGMGRVTAPPARTTAMSTGMGQVMAFHSSSKWKAYFEASKQTSKLIVIDFTASWCGPCKYMQLAIEEFAQTYKDVDFVKIDVDELEDVAQEFEVQALPNFILIKYGKEMDQVVGAKKEDLRKKIEKHRF